MRINGLISGKLAEKIRNLPPLPATVQAVIAVTSNPDSSTKDLIRAILPDPVLCSLVLKMANSAFLGQCRKVATLEKAVVVLGFDEIRNIILGKAVCASFASLSRTSAKSIAPFWKHSFACGLAAKSIAEDLGCSAGELFIAGLLHDIGKLVMLMAFPGQYQLFGENETLRSFPSTSTEKDTYSCSHDLIGQILFRQWLLPEQICVAAGFHHDPLQAQAFLEYSVIVQLADLLATLYLNDIHYTPDDISQILSTFPDSAQACWQHIHQPWDPERIGRWYMALVESHQLNGDILNLLAP